MSLFTALDTDNIKEEFVLLLEKLILTGRLKAGDRLPPERILASHYGVSRPVIHEGILILENKGMVTLRPRHGVLVNNFRKQGTLDMLLSLVKENSGLLEPGLAADLEHFRIHMEKDIVSLICRRGREAAEDLLELEKINNKMAKAKSSDELAELDFQFHLQMSLSSGNILYSLLYNTLKPAHTDLLSQFYRRVQTRNQVVKYHNQLIDALRSGDSRTAGELIEKVDSYNAYEQL